MRADKRPQPCDVTVYSDKGSLALRFPKRHNPLWEQLDSKPLNGKAKCLGIGKYGYKDNPEDWKRATQLAIALEADLDHPEWEKLFDPTLAKYGLGGGKYAKLADVLQLPGTVQAKPEITVGEMWEAYLEWKVKYLQPTTFKIHFSGGYTNALKGLTWNKTIKDYENNGFSVWNKPLSADLANEVLLIPLATNGKRKLLQALNEAFCRVQSLGKTKLAINPFHELWKVAKPDIREGYKPVVIADGSVFEWWEIADANESINPENDCRSFSKEERDIIIKGFYESPKPQEQRIAPMIEFSFLTGCRPGEAFALTWGDVMFERNIVRFSKSYNGKLNNVQTTKTKEIRIFNLYPRLKNLLVQIQPTNTQSTDLVFPDKSGKPFHSTRHNAYWLGCKTKFKGVERYYPGVVARLIEEGKLSRYLSPYHTRHTYITLTAHANKQDNNALLYIASACGNSVDVIMKHYLGVVENTQITQVE